MNDERQPMTTTCECGNVYGLWRTQCPACGTHNAKRAAAMERKEKEERKVRAARPREPRKNECVLCRKRVKGKRIKGTKLREAPERCPHCDECCHPACQKLHGPTCQQFQIERNAELARLGVGVNPLRAQR